jgi:hypothetical protein
MSPARDPLQGEPAGIEVVSTRTFPDDPGPPTSPGLSRGASASFRLYPLAFRKPSLRARGRAIRPKEATSRPWGWVRSPYPFTRAPPACGWKSAPAWTIRTERLGGDYELSVRFSPAWRNLAVAFQQPESVLAREGGRALLCGDFLPAAFWPPDFLLFSPQPCRTRISPGRTLRYPHCGRSLSDSCPTCVGREKIGLLAVHARKGWVTCPHPLS